MTDSMILLNDLAEEIALVLTENGVRPEKDTLAVVFVMTSEDEDQLPVGASLNYVGEPPDDKWEVSVEADQAQPL